MSLKKAILWFLAMSKDLTNETLVSVALAIMRLTISKLVWNFDIEETSPSRTWMSGQRIHILWKPKPLFLRLTPANNKA